MNRWECWGCGKVWSAPSAHCARCRTDVHVFESERATLLERIEAHWLTPYVLGFLLGVGFMWAALGSW